MTANRIPVTCGCGWTALRYPGLRVVCPCCGAIAEFVWTKDRP